MMYSPRRRQHSGSSRLAWPGAGRFRRAFLERLEDRSLLASLPFGALPDDTGEFMLGDVLVSVVLMESDDSLSPFDENTENWNSGLIADVKGRIQEGLNWWSQTLDALPDVRDGLLSYTIDWTYANSPVHTGYEPISRPSTDFNLWVQDFLDTVGFTQENDFLANLRAFNNAQRIAHQKHWAFTLFVVNNAEELASGGDGRFAPGGLSLAFAYAGGHAIVIPQDRPATTVAHETGHMFWAHDEYNRTSTQYNLRRGYYDTQNTNADPNPAYVPQDSIMSSGPSLTAAYANFTSSTASLEMIGWKDSDSDGIFDLLDVPFSLDGSGQYDEDSGVFRFLGTSAVRTLQNRNPSGLQNDITINEIREAQYKFDNGSWQTAASYQAYQVDLNLEIDVPAGAATITLRTIDTRTGVTSGEYVHTLSGPPGQFTPGPGAGGFVIDDPDGDGFQDPGEFGLGGWFVGLVDPQGNPLNLRGKVDSDQFPSGGILDVFNTGVFLSGVGGDVSSAHIRALDSWSAPGAGLVFGAASSLEGGYQDTFTGARRLMAEFQAPVTSVSIRAYGVAEGSVARMEAFNDQGEVIKRVTSGVISAGGSQTLSIAAPNIAYVIVKGHAGTKVALDNLEWGGISSTTTDALGAWTLPTLPPGEYRVAVSPKPFYVQTGPETGYVEIIVDEDGTRGGDFFFRHVTNPWRNELQPLDVNIDGSITPRDVLALVNWLNSHAGQPLELPPEPEAGDFKLDVSDDGRCSPLDVLLVVNELNRLAGQVTTGSVTHFITIDPPRVEFIVTQPSPQAEGEDSPLLGLSGAALSTGYYANAPLHAEELPGIDPDSGGCTCGQCQAIAEVALSRVGSVAKHSLPDAAAAQTDRAERDEHFDTALLSILADEADIFGRRRH